MIEVFNEYVNAYDMNNPKIRLKYDHSFRVMDLSLKYAKILGFNEEDTLLAGQIGLLHDIGRFEQARKYNTLNDLGSIDHADLGVKILFEDNLIDKFNIDRKNYEIIKKTIKNHNKYEIQARLNERELLHAKLIRDTDKLDILYNAAYLNHLDLTTTSEGISPLVLDDILNRRCVKSENVRNNNDRIVRFLAFVFNIYNDECLKEISEHIKIVYERLEYKQKFEEVYNLIMDYIEERIGQNVR